ncbi:MAG: ankyrin repeat domain-containing protein [Leptospiraceae bacterium]|nr:ankyrin repeat domain-containing protein [Leptospiraceae bacterium]
MIQNAMQPPSLRGPDRRRAALSILSALLLSALAFSPTVLRAEKFEITPENYQQILPNRTVVAYLSLDCDMGGYAASLFTQAMYDLRGPDLGIININNSSFLHSSIEYDLGSIIIIRNGQVVASSETAAHWMEVAGFNGRRRWVAANLRRLGITFSGLQSEGPDRMKPVSGPAGVSDLKKGLAAFYRFNGDLKDDTGVEMDMDIDAPVFQIKDNALQGNGRYDMESSAHTRITKTALPGPGGLTVAFNFRLEPHEGEACLNEVFFSMDGGRMDLACDKGILWLQLEGYQEVSGGEDKYWKDVYPLKDANLQTNQWHTLVISLDWSARRGRLVFDGKRLQDFRLDSHFMALLGEDGLKHFSFTQFRSGAVLKGSVDDFSIWDRPLTDAELLQYHKLYARSGSTSTVDNNTPTEAEKDQAKLNLDLLKAAYAGDADAVEDALDDGAQVDTRYQGWTALMYAAHFGHTEVVEVLIEHQADALIELDGYNAGLIAKNQGHQQITTMLEDYMNTERFYFERSVREPKFKLRSLPTEPQ